MKILNNKKGVWKGLKKKCILRKEDLIKDEDDRNGLLECPHRSGLDGWVSFLLSFFSPVDSFLLLLLFEAVSGDFD